MSGIYKEVHGENKWRHLVCFYGEKQQTPASPHCSETFYRVGYAPDTLTHTALAFLWTWALTRIPTVHTDQKEGFTTGTVATTLWSLMPQDHLSPELPVLTKLSQFACLLKHLEVLCESHLGLYISASHSRLLHRKILFTIKPRQLSLQTPATHKERR